MGREARCTATWGTQRGEVTALLESREIVVRGAFRAKASLASVRDVRVVGEMLRFRADGVEVGLALGSAARRWADAIVATPPSLAAKLGITERTRVLVEGVVDDYELAHALAAGATVAEGDADMLIARVDALPVLARILSTHADALARGVPLWVVYVKGQRAPLGETAVRTALRERGLVDVKVASVSDTLSALKFACPRAAQRIRGGER